LEAQQAAIHTFWAQHGYEVADSYSEVETGKGSDALDQQPRRTATLARRTKAPAIVAKLDRHGRGHFIAGLMANRAVQHDRVVSR
jgi:hypothetical protein